MDKLAPFDPKALCVKCGWDIPEPPPPEPKFGPKGADGNTPQLPAPPPTPPTPPLVEYCNGSQCPWIDMDGDGEADPPPMDEHMHQWCQTCGYEWLTAPLG